MSRSITLKKIDGKPGQVYYPLQLNHNAKPVPGPGEVLVRLEAAALNHRDHFQRQHLYPGISFEHALLADGCGIVESAGPDTGDDDGKGSAAAAAALVGRRVILMPSRGWDSAPEGPESAFTTIGGAVGSACGAAQDYVAVPAAEVELAPAHLTAAEAAALPLVGLTGWRALVSKSGNALPGRNILVTGIGGGVALAVLQFAVALGCNAYVTSGSAAKLERAVRELGAKGGVSYRDADWDRQLAALLPPSRPFLDAVVDGAGGDIMARAVRLLKPGGVVSSYGMTLAPKMDWVMVAVLKNVELRGSTMGSRREFRDMVDFVREREIRPVVSRVAKGLDNFADIEALFEDIREGRQFGKLVIQIAPDEKDSARL
ncbi:putative zinc-binding dehydrogenase [Rosellinia necatrix]|uniref:Putative zinc-binding dehydrogenase n=1 Tax=Rosellinia necatrix TaxID=77044 RepID=A0A1S7UJY8_ROSNE|nr:putative zinc-binding dehydrogenase [Rosellinia necatrix]